MRILLLTQVVPNPPDSGPKMKTHYMLRYLAQRHEVTLVSLVRSVEEVAAAQALQGMCKAVYTAWLYRSRTRDIGYLLASLGSKRPFLLLRDESRDLRRLLKRLLASQQ